MPHQPHNAADGGLIEKILLSSRPAHGVGFAAEHKKNYAMLRKTDAAC